MKAAILKLLRARQGGYLSGEEIGRQLGISRNAIWKYVKGLREAGYVIDSQPHKGHCLVEAPDLLYPEEIQAGLGLEVFGQAVHYRRKVDSTNIVARQLADEGVPEGTVVVAEAQVQGRGRLGRHWVSPPGKGVWMSLVLRPPVNPVNTSLITLLGAVAVSRAIRTVTGLNAGIKWPNDVFINQRKVCGILSEMKAEIDMVHNLVMGIGINVNLQPADFPPDVLSRATSLALEAGGPVSRVKLVQAVLREMEGLYQQFKQEGPAPIRQAWLDLNVTLGKTVLVTSGQEQYPGIAEDVDGEGALLVRGPDGSLRKFYAGEVTLKGTPVEDGGCRPHTCRRGEM